MENRSHLKVRGTMTSLYRYSTRRDEAAAKNPHFTVGEVAKTDAWSTSTSWACGQGDGLVYMSQEVDMQRLGRKSEVRACFNSRNLMG